jgi:hypothetical protein
VVVVPGRAGAQTGLSPADTEAIMVAAMQASVRSFSSNRRFFDAMASKLYLAPRRVERLAAIAKARLSPREAYEVCDASGHCRIAPDAEVISIEAPTIVSPDTVLVRVVMRQGTHIKRMPVATGSDLQLLTKRSGRWKVSETRSTRQ